MISSRALLFAALKPEVVNSVHDPLCSASERLTILRRHLIVHHEACPECNGELDTGFECTACGFDALPERQAIASISTPGDARS